MIADAIGLDLRAYGALTMLRDIMFDNGGSFRDDARVISKALGCDPRGWPPIRKMLLESRKLYETEGTLRSPYVDKTLADQERFRRQQETRGHLSAAMQHKRRMDAASLQQGCKENPAKSLKSHEVDSTTVQPNQNPKSRYKEKKRENGSAASSAALEGVVGVVASEDSKLPNSSPNGSVPSGARSADSSREGVGERAPPGPKREPLSSEPKPIAISSFLAQSIERWKR
jgi:hypothetical protein